jgi:flagellar basal body-associated protein FliL
MGELPQHATHKLLLLLLLLVVVVVVVAAAAAAVVLSNCSFNLYSLCVLHIARHFKLHLV